MAVMMINEYYCAVDRKQRYRLIVNPRLWGRIMTLAELSSLNEILGIGMITKRCVGYNTDFILDEIFVPRQEVAANYCSFADGAQDEIINEILKRGDSTEKLCFWWRSHGKGSVFFSATDDKAIDNCGLPYVVNLVVNAYQDSIARLDVLDPVRVRNIPLKIFVDVNAEGAERAKCLSEIGEKCKKASLGQRKSIRWRGKMGAIAPRAISGEA